MAPALKAGLPKLFFSGVAPAFNHSITESRQEENDGKFGGKNDRNRKETQGKKRPKNDKLKD